MADSHASGGGGARRSPERPLSPHLQIYRWTIPMALSIVHRMTGMALGAGTLLLAWWLMSLAQGPAAYARVAVCLGSLPGRAVLAGFTWALIYHLLNGIRHLFWDAGFGYSIPVARGSGRLVLLLSVLLTVGAWAVGLGLVTFGPGLAIGMGGAGQ